MKISFDVPPGVTPGECAVLVKNLIEGAARGWVTAPPGQRLSAFQRWNLPPLYESGVRFAYEDGHGTGNEEFQSPWLTFKRKKGDCDDLIIYRLCETWCAGVGTSCFCEWVMGDMHVKVRFPTGELEDPAVLLGAPDPNRQPQHAIVLP